MEKSDGSVLVSESIGKVSLIIYKPEHAVAVLVLGHGAGAGMKHPFMESLAAALASRDIATVRYNFPYMENKKKRPDFAPVAEKTVARVIGSTQEEFKDTPLFAGGKSFGGRMTSQWLSKDAPAYVNGIIFFGFPLHQVGAPSAERAVHLRSIKIPMLFLQGSRDKMAEMSLLSETCVSLPTATLITLEGADHSFKSGKIDFIPALAEHSARWIRRQTPEGVKTPGVRE